MSSFQAIQYALCFPHFPVTDSNAFMIFSEQFNTYAQGTLMILKRCFEITYFTLCYPQEVVRDSSTLVFFSKLSLIRMSRARGFEFRAALKSPILSLSYPQFVVTVSRTLVFFSKQFNTCAKRTLVRLKSCFEIT